MFFNLSNTTAWTGAQYQRLRHTSGHRKTHAYSRTKGRLRIVDGPVTEKNVVCLGDGIVSASGITEKQSSLFFEADLALCSARSGVLGARVRIFVIFIQCRRLRFALLCHCASVPLSAAEGNLTFARSTFFQPCLRLTTLASKILHLSLSPLDSRINCLYTNFLYTASVSLSSPSSCQVQHSNEKPSITRQHTANMSPPAATSNGHANGVNGTAHGANGNHEGFRFV